MVSELKILVIDDSAASRQTVRIALADIGYTNAETASNGAEGLAKCQTQKFDVVFLDWNMPEMDGLSFLKAYRQTRDKKESAVVMVTAKNDKNDILTAIENGANAFIGKPVSAEDIQKKMQQIVASLSPEQR